MAFYERCVRQLYRYACVCICTENHRNNVYQDAVINNGIVSFDASHFSKYALVEMTAGSGVVFWALCMAAAIGAFVVTFAKGRQCK